MENGIRGNASREAQEGDAGPGARLSSGLFPTGRVHFLAINGRLHSALQVCAL